MQKPYRAGATGRALDLVRTDVLVTSAGHRLGVETLVVVISDGGSLENETVVVTAANNLRSTGARIIGQSAPPTTFSTTRPSFFF